MNWRTLRIVMMVALPVVMAVEMAQVGWSQLPPPNPLVVPQPPPSPPAQLPAPVSTAVAPPVMAIPSQPAAYSTPGPRVFNCSCFGPGVGIRWMGQVTAPSYFDATQSAGGACVAYMQAKAPPRYGAAGGIGAANNYGPLPGTGAGAANGRVTVPDAAQPPGAANNYPALSSGLTFNSAMCAQCTCD